jgi:hypothetical protein
MTEFCKQIFFYDNPIIELSQIMNILKPHMYTTTTLNAVQQVPCQDNKDSIVTPKTNIVEETPVILDNPQNVPKKVDQKMEHIKPNLIDSLFWCLYIINYGYNDFQQITRNHRVKQLEIQSKVIDKINKDKNCMKTTNFKFTNIAIQEVISDLLTITKAINYNTAMSLCVLYNINIYIIDNSKGVYIKLISNTDIELPTYAIYREKLNTYSVDIEALTADKITALENLICLESYLRPLKTISNYKIVELTELANKFKLLEEDKKYKKQELYELVYNKIRWE